MIYWNHCNFIINDTSIKGFVFRFLGSYLESSQFMCIFQRNKKRSKAASSGCVHITCTIEMIILNNLISKHLSPYKCLGLLSVLEKPCLAVMEFG